MTARFPPNPLPCGCAIKHEYPESHLGDYIVFCPLHSAAEDLLISLEHLAHEAAIHAKLEIVASTYIVSAFAAIAKARAEKSAPKGGT